MRAIALVFVFLFLTFPEISIADGCVAGLTLSGSKRAGGLAVGDVVSITSYPDLATCNKEMAVVASLLPKEPVAKALPADSLTFVCKIPTGCYVPDQWGDGSFERVVLLRN